MITKAQWNYVCKKIAEKRAEGKTINYGYAGMKVKKVQACFFLQNKIVLDDETVLTHKNINQPSMSHVMRLFSWTEIHYIDDNVRVL